MGKRSREMTEPSAEMVGKMNLEINKLREDLQNANKRRCVNERMVLDQEKEIEKYKQEVEDARKEVVEMTEARAQYVEKVVQESVAQIKETERQRYKVKRAKSFFHDEKMLAWASVYRLAKKVCDVQGIPLVLGETAAKAAGAKSIKLLSSDIDVLIPTCMFVIHNYFNKEGCAWMTVGNSVEHSLDFHIKNHQLPTNTLRGYEGIRADADTLFNHFDKIKK